jgi:hypothetical protein
MSKHFTNKDWSNAYAHNTLLYGLDEFAQGAGTTYGEKSAAIKPTRIRFTTLNRINVARENLLTIGTDTRFINFA